MNKRSTHDFIRELEYRVKCLEKMISIRDQMETEAIEDFKNSMVREYGEEIRVYDVEQVTKNFYQNWLERLFKHPKGKETVEFKRPTRELNDFVEELDLVLYNMMVDSYYAKEEKFIIKIKKEAGWVGGLTLQLNQKIKTSEFLEQLIERFGVSSIVISRMPANPFLSTNESNFNALIAIHKKVINKTNTLGSHEWLLYTDDYKEIYIPIDELVHDLAVIPKR